METKNYKKAEDKSIIRKRMLNIRKNMTLEDINSLSHLISDKVLDIAEEYKDRPICAYSSIKNEADISFAIKKLLQDKRIIAMPRVFGDYMDFYIINSYEDLEAGYFGILEPKRTCKKLIPTNALVFLPGSGYSKDKKRIGYGKGYYDRFFEDKKDNILVGVGYSFQTGLDFYCSEYDISMDLIINDKEVV